MKNILLILCLIFLTGCASIDNAVFGGARRRDQRIEEQHQRLMELYGLQAEMVKAKLAGDTNITDSDIMAVNASINEIETQQRYKQQIQQNNELLRMQQQQHQQQMDQLRQMEDDASFDRMMRGGLP